MTHIIDLTTPEKLEAFGKQLHSQKDDLVTNLKQVDLRAKLHTIHSEIQYVEAKDTFDHEDYAEVDRLKNTRSKLLREYDGLFTDGWRPWK